MSELITQDYGVGDVLSLLWFKRKLPKWVACAGSRAGSLVVGQLSTNLLTSVA